MYVYVNFKKNIYIYFMSEILNKILFIKIIKNYVLPNMPMFQSSTELVRDGSGKYTLDIFSSLQSDASAYFKW